MSNASLSVVPGSLADEIAVLAAQLDAATHRLLTCIRQFDESAEWEAQGAASCAHWLAWRIGLDTATARERVRVARALGALPVADGCLARGEISYAKVRALTRVATPENESQLCEMARDATAAQLERICRRFRSVRRQMDECAPGDADERTVRVRSTDSGRLRIEVTLHPDEADLVLRAIEKARDELRRSTSSAAAGATDVSAETSNLPSGASTGSVNVRPTPSRVDGLLFLAEGFLAARASVVDARAAGGAVNLPRQAAGAHRYQVLLHLDRTLFGPEGAMDVFLDDGTRVAAEAFRRVSCDAALAPVTVGAEGQVLDVGRRSRTIPAAIRRVLWLRDRGCRFPGCANARFVHGHHIRHWAHGGPTSVENLVLLCSFHHQLVHEGGFGVRGGEGGPPVFTDPRGRVLDELPMPPAPIEDADLSDVAPPLANPDDTLCGWRGEAVDYDAAVDALIVSSVG